MELTGWMILYVGMKLPYQISDSYLVRSNWEYYVGVSEILGYCSKYILVSRVAK